MYFGHEVEVNTRLELSFYFLFNLLFYYYM